MTESVLTFSNIATGYGSKKILEDITLDVTKRGNPHIGRTKWLRQIHIAEGCCQTTAFDGRGNHALWQKTG